MSLKNARYHSDFKKFLEESENPSQAHLKLIAKHGKVISQRQAYTWAKAFSEDSIATATFAPLPPKSKS